MPMPFERAIGMYFGLPSRMKLLAVAICIIVLSLLVGSKIWTATTLAFAGETETGSSFWIPTVANSTNGVIPAQSLPEALGPVTFEGCCEGPVKAAESTCLTERACSDSLYPFSTEEEALMFQEWDPSPQEIKEKNQRCNTAQNTMAPPTRWCSNRTHFYAFPMGCSQHPVNMGRRSGPYDRLILFPEAKLAFCGIPKVGITKWLQFLRFVIGAKDYQSYPYYKNDTQHFIFDMLKPHVQEKIWNDSSWTKAILIRHPAERLLSAYLDKVRPNKKDAPFGPNVTFAEFVDIVAQTNTTKGENHRKDPGLSWYTDPHWRPQAWSCGLSDDMPRMDYIGSLNNAAHHSKSILERVHLWDSYGKHYRVSKAGEKKGNYVHTWPPEPLKPGETAAGFQQQVLKDGKDAMDTQGHSRGSRAKIDEYYAPYLLDKVTKLYWMDFKLWSALQEAEREGVVSGKDIASKLNPHCAA